MNTYCCHFCLEQISSAPIEELTKFGMQVYFCHTCLAEYVFVGNGKSLSHYNLYATINNKMYRWTINDSCALLRYVKCPGQVGSIVNRDLGILKIFKSDIPIITPQNIKDKLQTYLIFL